MAKTKSVQPDKAIKSSKDAQVKSISSVKQGAVTKPSQTSKSKSKDIAKQVAVKADKVGKEEKKSKKEKKEPVPEPISSESDEEDEEDSSATSDSSDESEDEVPAPKAAAKTNGVKTNGMAKIAPAAESEDEDSGSSESSASSDDDMEETTAAKSAPAAVVKDTVAGAKEESESEASSEEASSEDDEEESDEETENKGPVDAKALNGKLEKVASKEVCNKTTLLSKLWQSLTLTGFFRRGVWQR